MPLPYSKKHLHYLVTTSFLFCYCNNYRSSFFVFVCDGDSCTSNLHSLYGKFGVLDGSSGDLIIFACSRIRCCTSTNVYNIFLTNRNTCLGFVHDNTINHGNTQTASHLLGVSNKNCSLASLYSFYRNCSLVNSYGGGLVIA